VRDDVEKWHLFCDSDEIVNSRLKTDYVKYHNKQRSRCAPWHINIITVLLLSFFGPRNASPSASNVVRVLLVVVI